MANSKDLKKKTIITAALVGGRTTKEQNPNTPYSPEEYAEEAKNVLKKERASYTFMRDLKMDYQL